MMQHVTVIALLALAALSSVILPLARALPRVERLPVTLDSAA